MRQLPLKSISVELHGRVSYILVSFLGSTEGRPAPSQPSEVSFRRKGIYVRTEWVLKPGAGTNPAGGPVCWGHCLWLLSIQHTPAQQKTHFIRLLIHVLCFSASASSSCALGEMTPPTVSKMGGVSPKEIVFPASNCYLKGSRLLGQWNTRYQFLAAPSLFWGTFWNCSV